jgi:hypothetical protein
MNELLQSLGDNLVYVIIGVCFVIGMALRAVTTIVTGQSREKSRREIAAYVAEGSITPEHAERLIKAEVRSARIGQGCC